MNPTGTHQARCSYKPCRKITRVEGTGWAGRGEFKRVCECGTRLTLKPILARVSEHKCGLKCTSAVGPNCECECGGERHGEDHG